MHQRSTRELTTDLTSEPRGERGFWRRRLAAGLALGVAIATLEFAHYFALVSAPVNLGAEGFAALLLGWCGESALLILSVGAVERAAIPRQASAAQYAFAVVFGSVWGVLAWESALQFLGREWLGIPLFIDLIKVRANWFSVVLYRVWILLFFGGLAIAVYGSERRRAQNERMFRAAEIERATVLQQIADTRFTALQAQADPDFLLRTLSRFELLYEAEPAAADRVMDDLIVYLRNPPRRS
jgi:hypothetical protein